MSCLMLYMQAMDPMPHHLFLVEEDLMAIHLKDHRSDSYLLENPGETLYCKKSDSGYLPADQIMRLNCKA